VKPLRLSYEEMRKRKYVSLSEQDEGDEGSELPPTTLAEDFPVPQCHNIVSTSQIVSSQPSIDLQRLADLFPFTTYDRKRFAAITIRLANPHCTCLLFGSGKLVITGSTSFGACIVASHEITRILRRSSPRDLFEVASCQIQNLVAHVSLEPGTTIDLNRLYERFNEQSTYQRSIFPGALAPLTRVGWRTLTLLYRPRPAPAAVADRAAHLHVGAHRVHRGALVRGHLLWVRGDLQHAAAVHPGGARRRRGLASGERERFLTKKSKRV